MGFLLGMAGKLAAGQRARTLQAKMMRVQSNLRRVTSEYSNMEKYINSWKNNRLSEVRGMGLAFQQGVQWANPAADLVSYFKANGGEQFLDNNGQVIKTAVENDRTSYNMLMQGFNTAGTASMTAMSQMNQNIQVFMQMQQSAIEQQVEMMKESMLQPLKDTEDDLTLEKDSLESQIQIAQQDYEACKEMEKDGAKNLRPQYTGDGRA